MSERALVFPSSGSDRQPFQGLLTSAPIDSLALHVMPCEPEVRQVISGNDPLLAPAPVIVLH
jgi:hypothetical protein